MGLTYPALLFVALFLILLLGIFATRGKGSPGATWLVLLGIVGLVAAVRGYQFASNFQLLMAYAIAVTLSYCITYYTVVVLYVDPAEDETALESLTRKVKVLYIIPVYNEKGDISQTINSILESADRAADIAEVELVLVNDASTDDTAERLDAFASIPRVRIMHLSKNAGKKGAITIGTYGGENWREAFQLFRKKYKKEPEQSDYARLISCLKQAGCTPPKVDLYLHTDSDSYVSKDFIRNQIIAFASDDRIGAVSGHCDVWLPPDSKPTLITQLQVRWYHTQFSIRKAAESVYGSVFCVSGPGAGFKRDAIFHRLPEWVDDMFGGKVYKGATDRMLTLIVLEGGWLVRYSKKANVWTTVPENIHEIRRQWTRWKQNFWRMLLPVWKYAWRRHPVVAFLTYARLVVTMLAPFILAFHIILVVQGEYLNSVIYLSGIALMGTIFGVAFATQKPQAWKYALLRPGMSLFSAFWGSMLTLRALVLTFRGSFTWRESAGKSSRGRIINRWFVPTFELRFIEIVLLIGIILRFLGIHW